MSVERKQVKLILKDGSSLLLDSTGRLPSWYYVPFRTPPRPDHPGSSLPGKITPQEIKKFVRVREGGYVEVDK